LSGFGVHQSTKTGGSIALAIVDNAAPTSTTRVQYCDAHAAHRQSFPTTGIRVTGRAAHVPQVSGFMGWGRGYHSSNPADARIHSRPGDDAQHRVQSTGFVTGNDVPSGVVRTSVLS
jgi:hypothetical protein